MKTAFIFPAFISEYIGSEIQILDAFSSNFQHYLHETSKITGDDFEEFSLENTAFTENELRSQLISYVFSCSLSDTLITRGLKPDILAGYSMGLYAALHTGGAIDFEDGIKLIKQAYIISKSTIADIESGMGSIIGLTQDEIEEIIATYKLEAEIANTNSVHSHLVTGRLDAVNHLLNNAIEIGALSVALLNVKTPYHSKLLKGTLAEFQQFISDEVPLKKTNYPIISSINQRLVKTPDDIKTEITNNLFGNINWMHSFEKLVNVGVTQFIECGAGKSLQKISRFIPGDFKIYPMSKIKRLLT